MRLYIWKFFCEASYFKWKHFSNQIFYPNDFRTKSSINEKNFSEREG